MVELHPKLKETGRRWILSSWRRAARAGDKMMLVGGRILSKSLSHPVAGWYLGFPVDPAGKIIGRRCNESSRQVGLRGRCDRAEDVLVA